MSKHRMSAKEWAIICKIVDCISLLSADCKNPSAARLLHGVKLEMNELISENISARARWQRND